LLQFQNDAGATALTGLIKPLIVILNATGELLPIND